MAVALEFENNILNLNINIQYQFLFLTLKSNKMTSRKAHFMYSPGGENESSTTPNNDNNKDQPKEVVPKPKEEGKSILKKIKDALQDWSNDDKREQEFDENSPIT